MTEYFEVHERDGAARTGELRLRDPATTPALVDDLLRDPGSRWVADRDLPEGDDTALTVLPHRAFPAGTDQEVQDAFAVDYPDVDYPSAAVVTAETAADHGADAYILSELPGSVGHAAAFVETLIQARETLPADAALYLSGVATPGNVATLAYAGIDLFDAKRARVSGRQGRYLTTEGEHELDRLEELPCACSACAGGLASFDRAACAEHNVAVLRAQLATVRSRIRAGRLRDYIEAQARHEAWHTAAFRELDQQYGYLEQRTPIVRNADLLAASEDALDRVEIQRFAERVTERYRTRFDNPLVLVPCSAEKPYSESQSHRQFHDAIQFRAHKVSMTSPIGVVPQELELTYPAQHYDTVVTGEWTEGEKAFVTTVLTRYLKRNDYPRVIAHLPPGAYHEICETAADRAGVDIEFTVDNHPTTEESIATLMRTLSDEPKYSKQERRRNAVEAIADVMLGPGAGDSLFAGVDVQLTSRYPKLQVRDRTRNGEQLAAMVPSYGTLAFTLAGARQWVDSDAPTKRIEIDAFVPHGSVLAPGVIDADAEIRSGDEVVIEGPNAFGVGRATMSGPEMVESTRGIASEVRHVEER